jgi:proline racemase
MHARGEAPPGTRLVAESIIGSRFVGRIADSSQVGDLAAVIPTIEGRARIFGERRLLLDPDDPWPLGYRVSDTWPG